MVFGCLGNIGNCWGLWFNQWSMGMMREKITELKSAFSPKHNSKVKVISVKPYENSASYIIEGTIESINKTTFFYLDELKEFKFEEENIL